MLEELKKLEPDVIVLGSAATYEFTEASWIDGSSRIFERVSKAAGSVYVIPGTPSLTFDGPGCLDRGLTPEGHINGRNCVSENRLQHVEPVARHLRKAALRFDNVHVLDLNDLVCPGGTCRAVAEDGQVVFRDSQHLTDSFVRSRIPLLRERLDRLGRR